VQIGHTHRSWLRLVAFALGTWLCSCVSAPKLRGQMAALTELAAQAERNGAIRCAPRELALARSHLAFAETELEQGFATRAEHHLWVAEPNAHAALFLSPPQYCTDRQIIDPKPGDRDGDGYPDPQDKCPDDPENFNNFEDEDGCPDNPDTDGDGIPDETDVCELMPEDRDGYLDTDGCPDLDNDLDGIPDDKDQCPMEPEDPDGFEDEDGCPDPDNDRDEVLDVKDQCPNEPGDKLKEPIGCPSKPSLVIVTNCEVKITQQIHFEYNKDTIRAVSFPVLDAVADALRTNKTIQLEVQGHTDNRGTARYNKDLSNRRAASVMRYLTRNGIDASRLTSQGYGFDRPIVPNDTDSNRALNRRVQFVRTEASAKECERP
jgi:outer membrane protein OmpA-like peptidoglycan-associated protein